MPRCLGSESPSRLSTGLCVIVVFLVSGRVFVFGFCSWMLFDLSIISGFVEWTCLVRECDAHGQVDLWDSPDVAMSAVTMTSCSSRWKASLKSGADEVWNIFNTVLVKSCHLDVVANATDVRYCTVGVGCDNTPSVSRFVKGATTAKGGAGALCRTG